MKCLDKFNKKMMLSGGSLRNENIKNSRMILRETFFDDASFAHGLYMWERGLKSYVNRETLSIRIYKRAYSSANGVTMKFQTLYDSPVVVGDVIYDSKTDEYLLCTESFDIDHIHWQGKLTLCNWILKWQKPDGEILEYPCHDVNATQYNSGEQSNKQFTIGSSQHMVYLPYDENTVVLRHPQRFFLDRDTTRPTSFMVTQNDTTSYGYGKKGIVQVTLLEHVYNPDTDRPDLGICDYIGDEALVTGKSVNGVKVASKSEILCNKSIIKSGGSSQVFVGKFFDDDGNEVANVEPHWKIICDFSSSLQVEEVGNQLVIGIDDDNYVDEEFKIVLSDSDGNRSSSLIVKVESLL